MAYTSGIFRIDISGGSDAARAALTSCTASNPSGSIVNINKTAHGLVTGAIVDLTLFSSWLNEAWKITVVDADNFTLDGAVWQTTADNSGTATPRGGSSWSDAWLTVNSGATAARIQPGDEIRISKTADPVSLGQNATFTDGSPSVTLTTAVTKTIEDAISGWTASANIAESTNSNRKIGSTAEVFTPAGAFTTGKVAYKAISGGGTQDFSAYQKICFWFRPTASSAIAANTYKICLCSDATGDTIVNEINIPATLANSAWHIMELDYGAALSSSVQSVAIYANSDPGTTAFSINNIFATNNLSLRTLIGKIGDVNYNVQSISGTTIRIDANNTSATSRGYGGTTSTETLYYQVPFDMKTTGTLFTIQEAGSVTARSIYSGGWNTSDVQDGTTVIASLLVGVGMPFSLVNYVRLTNFSFPRAGNSWTFGSHTEIDNIVFSGSPNPVFTSQVRLHFSNCKMLNLSGSWYVLGFGLRVSNCSFFNSAGSGFVFDSQLVVGSTFRNNASGSVSPLISVDLPCGGFRNCVFLDALEVSVGSGQGFVWSYDHDNTQGNHWGFGDGATINWQTSVKHDTEPGAWRTTTTSSSRGLLFPIPLRVAQVACNANALVTVKAWVKKDHATNIGCQILVEDELWSINGVAATSATKANNTDWEELTITFTPTEAGVVTVWMRTWYVSGNSSAYVGAVTITQA